MSDGRPAPSGQCLICRRYGPKGSLCNGTDHPLYPTGLAPMPHAPEARPGLHAETLLQAHGTRPHDPHVAAALCQAFNGVLPTRGGSA